MYLLQQHFLQGLPTSWQKINFKNCCLILFLLEDFLNISSTTPGLSSNKPSSLVSNRTVHTKPIANQPLGSASLLQIAQILAPCNSLAGGTQRHGRKTGKTTVPSIYTLQRTEDDSSRSLQLICNRMHCCSETLREGLTQQLWLSDMDFPGASRLQENRVVSCSAPGAAHASLLPYPCTDSTITVQSLTNPAKFQ